MEVYINDVSSFLPNNPVNNEDIEDVLGMVKNRPSRSKRIVLRSNKIECRYYALDPATGRLTHSNAQLTAEAVRKLHPYENFNLEAIKCLCCGTSSPDVMLPGHANMVQGELGMPACEVVSTAGICISGMTAFKYAYMNVGTKQVENAVATGSELSSSFLRGNFFEPIVESDDDLDKNPIKQFDADFLRWMLSDGAGAVFLSGKKNPDHITLKVEWIDQTAFSGRLPTCMYGGGVKLEDGSVIGWRNTELMNSQQKKYRFAIRQDIKLLDREIVKTYKESLAISIEKHNLKPGEIDWYLPHYSSHFFRDKLFNRMKEINFEVPYEKWFTNLYTKGNTGSASIYIMLEEVFKSGKLKKGEKLLCYIPESGRFTHCLMLLTVV